eukprot:767070-Prymnesium_polylepis.1
MKRAWGRHAWCGPQWIVRVVGGGWARGAVVRRGAQNAPRKCAQPRALTARHPRACGLRGGGAVRAQAGQGAGGLRSGRGACAARRRAS